MSPESWRSQQGAFIWKDETLTSPNWIQYNCGVDRVLSTLYSCIPTDMLYCIIDTVVSKTWTNIFMKGDSTHILHFAKKKEILFTEGYSEILSNKLLTWCKIFSAGFFFFLNYCLFSWVISRARYGKLKENSGISNIEPPLWVVYDEIEWLTPKCWLLVLSWVLGSFQIAPACFRMAGYGHAQTCP